MASFSPIPDVPMEGMNLAESGLFRALKENVEILTGARINGVHTLTNDVVTIQPADNQQIKRVTAGATGYAIKYTNGAAVAADTNNIYLVSYTDYANLVADVQNVMNDLARVQNVVNSLIAQLRG